MGEIIGFHQTNQKTLHLLHLLYSDNTMCRADQQSAFLLVGAKVFQLADPCLDSMDKYISCRFGKTIESRMS